MATKIAEKPDGPRIVILDDADFHCRLLQGLITKIFPHAQIMEVRNVEEAIVVMKQNEISIALVDVHLENGHGSDILRAFPRNTRQFPILVVTIDQTQETLDLMFELGADDYLTKPIDPMVFENKLTSLLECGHLSPLNFFGNQRKIADANINFAISVREISEEQVCFESPLAISIGAIVHVKLGDIKIPMKVLENIPFKDGKGMCCICSPFLESMSREEVVIFRKQLMMLS